jgi:hypothetical protein
VSGKIDWERAKAKKRWTEPAITPGLRPSRKAMYPGTCVTCSREVLEGDEILWEPGVAGRRAWVEHYGCYLARAEREWLQAKPSERPTKPPLLT